ncbi:lactonase family protein [Kitasatospora viridis]|uniref:6-phosphogluconolactonase (Cycloisomerase 2 family) n=1 Tax=Kitasatospora viridis TaxID=281105 RepID=A0A561TVX1_9ACTN|nr:beta-propeller fold lactonase family protein [Kitasatospora viridis]TWF91244.1 6-phosphogluconolactonase (cycloisomerase 2 family) [Kitasatospora viridis]
MSIAAKNRRVRAALAVAAALGGALAVAGSPGVASASTGRAATVYTLSNAASGNAVLAFHDVNGALTPAGTYPTGGLGADAGLGSQGAVVPADHGRILLAVNAGSNSVTALRVTEDGALTARSTVASGGTRPVSVTVHGDLVYVLDSGSGTIAGFHLHDGVLTPLPGSTRALSAGAAGAAEVAFSPDGRRLVVTEKGSNSLDTFTVDRHGVPSAASRTASAAAVPFGFDFDSHGDAVVSDAAASAVTTYSVASGTARQLAYLPDGGGAACWLVVSRATGTAYVANAATGTISTYRVRDGALALTAPIAATVGGHPTDEALGRGDVLYVRDATNNRLQAVHFGAGGAQVIDSPSVLPASAVGIAVVNG